jgi:eukaryotic-like serine/threonine-protein kinase
VVRYRLGARIGGGGMAEVFEATLLGAEGFARPVAIKRMLPALSADPAFGAMFVNEARLASLLHHPGIVSVLDFDRDEEGRYFLVMELLRGVDLRRLLAAGPLPDALGAHVAARVLEGLAYAHELEHDGRHLGIVHRDVSPHNVMVSWDGGVKLVDFGIAKAVAATGVSKSGSLKGKVGYMSPEQAHGLELDGRSDVFAVGLMLHEMLSGRRVFEGATEAEVLARLLTQPIATPRQLRADVPSVLSDVVMRMLARDRGARFGSAHEALEALLAAPGLSPRAGLELGELVRARFPGEAPRRRAESEPNFVGMGAEAAPHPPAAAAGPPLLLDRTRTASSAVTPTAAGERRRSGKRGARRGLVWIAGAVIAAAGAVVTAALLGGGGAAIEPSAAVSGADAAAERALAVGREVEAEADAAVAPAGAADAEPATPAASERRTRRGSRTAPAAPPVAAAVAPDEAESAPAAPAEVAPPEAAPPEAAPPEAAPPGQVRIYVEPWAEILIDGKSHGYAPKTIELPVGVHHVVLRNEELGRREEVKVVVETGKTAQVRRTWR